MYVTLYPVRWTEPPRIFVHIVHVYVITQGTVMIIFFVFYILFGKNLSRPAFEDMEWNEVL